MALMAYAVALHHNRQHYAYAVALLNESKEELEELRDFYSRVLTKSFKDVQYMHKRTLISNEHYYNHTLSRLAEIAENCGHNLGMHAVGAADFDNYSGIIPRPDHTNSHNSGWQLGDRT